MNAQSVLYVFRAILFCLISCYAASAYSAPPNIVLILIDDLSHYGVSAYGSSQVSSTQGLFENVDVQTPRIDSIATHGVLCENAYAYPLCEPTRVALMSGMNNQRNFIKAKALHASQITFGDLFRQAGYATCITGKWKQSRGTKEFPGKDYIRNFGWDEFYCFDVVGEGKRMIDPFLVDNGKVIQMTGVDPQTGRRYYGPDLFNRYARQFIERHKDRPFFLYYPLVLVHDEHTPTPDTRPRELFDQFETRKPAEYGHGTGDERIYFPDMVRYMDKMVGKILDTLEETGVRDNTLVVLMADNGTKECFAHILADGSRYEGGKGSTAESGTRVPLLMQYPDRIPAGTRYSGLVDVTDILPTLCQVAGIQLPAKEAIDGVSFWPQVSGRMMKPHRSSIYTWYNANRSSRDIDERLAYAHTTLFKRYAPHKGFPEGRFFDLRVDPHEREGKAVVKYKWDDWHHTGLDITELTEEQKAAYDHLGEVLEANAYVPVTALQLPAGPVMMEVGETLPITCRILPANATRQNLIWKSSNPAVASVDKFGVLRARASGHIRLTVFSWEDAYPTAANQDESYLTSGIQNHIDIEVID